MKLRVLAVIAATLLMAEGAYAMDCCKGDKCACCAPKEAETPPTPGAKPHH